MNIVFDIGNVLLHWDPKILYRKIFATEDEADWFLGNVCTSAWNLELDRGTDLRDAVAEATERHPSYAEAIAAYDTRWHETLTHQIDGSVAILEELRSNGTPVYAITNWHQDKFRETRQRFPFLGHFRDIVVSGEEKVIKPDPAIYRILLDRNGIEASESLFIDDNPNNVTGAEAVGMKAHHFTSPQSLRAHLAGLGLVSP